MTTTDTQPAAPARAAAPASAADRLVGVIRLIRVRQWVKNGFVFAPLLFSGLLLEPDAVLASLYAFAFFSVVASAVYVVNDLHDVERDRQHPVKARKRPIASGVVRVPLALVVLGVLLAIATVGGIARPALGGVLAGYFALNVLYTYWLKYQPVIDIFCIAVGFVLRVVAGAVVLDVSVSSWMFITTLCLALFLAAIKRREELRHETAHQSRSVLRSYSVELVDRYAEMAATGALVFYSLFVVTEQESLVITIPLVLFGLFRYWYVTHQHTAGESPTDALLNDWQLIAVVLLWIAVCILVLWPGDPLLPWL